MHKNVLLLGEPEFEALGEGKVLFNTSIGPGFDSAALEKWLDKPGTHFFCDTYAAAGPVSEGFFQRPNVHSPGVSAGRTRQAFVLLSKKVLANIETVLGEEAITFEKPLHGRLCGGRRQPHEAHEHCHEAPVLSAVSAGLS